MSPQSENPGPSIWSRIVEKVGAKIGSYLALAALVFMAFCYVRAEVSHSAKDKAQAAELALTKAKVEAVTRDLEGVQGQLIKERDAKLTPVEQTFVAAVKKADPKAHVAGTSTTTVSIKDQDTSVATTAPGAPCPSAIVDSHNRFRFELPNGPLHREQKFTLDVVTVRGVDGAYSVQKTDFREYDPTTGEEIPSGGVTLTGQFNFVEDQPAGPGPWHPRAVVGVGYPFGVGGGIQFNPYKALTVGAVLLYQPNDKLGVGALTAGWRLFNSTISLGPFGGLNTKGALTGGVLATIEVTR